MPSANKPDFAEVIHDNINTTTVNKSAVLLSARSPLSYPPAKTNQKQLNNGTIKHRRELTAANYLNSIVDYPFTRN